MLETRSGRAEVAAVIARYAPRSVSSEVACFARTATALAAPSRVDRAKAFLFAAGKFASFAEGVGLALVPEQLFRPSVIERFTRVDGAAFSAPTLRTVRSNLYAMARQVCPAPGPVPLAREHAKTPYTEDELAAYFALARVQPTESRRRRTEGLLCLGAGAGLMGADLRAVTGTDVVCRFGGVVVVVRGKHPRTVPVLARYHETLLASATFAGERYVIGGRLADRRTVTTPLTASLAGGLDLPRLETARLRATWLVACAELLGLRAFMDAAGISCSQRLGDLVATLAPPAEADVVAKLSGTR